MRWGATLPSRDREGAAWDVDTKREEGSDGKR